MGHKFYGGAAFHGGLSITNLKEGNKSSPVDLIKYADYFEQLKSLNLLPPYQKQYNAAAHQFYDDVVIDSLISGNSADSAVLKNITNALSQLDKIKWLCQSDSNYTFTISVPIRKFYIGVDPALDFTNITSINIEKSEEDIIEIYFNGAWYDKKTSSYIEETNRTVDVELQTSGNFYFFYKDETFYLPKIAKYTNPVVKNPIVVQLQSMGPSGAGLHTISVECLGQGSFSTTLDKTILSKFKFEQINEWTGECAAEQTIADITFTNIASFSSESGYYVAEGIKLNKPNYLIQTEE